MPTQNQAQTRLTYRITEAASIIGVSRRTIERWIANGTLSAKRVHHTIFIPAADVHALIAIEA